MKINISTKGAYQIIRIEDELQIISDLSELRYLICGYLSRGKRYIAISFTNVSYIYSGAIAVLIDCYKLITKDHGELCIIESHTEILTVFKYLNLDKIIPYYMSVDDLPEIRSFLIDQ